MPAAARNGDSFTCAQPFSSGSGTHTGGAIQASGAAQVFINSQPAAVVGDLCICQEPGAAIDRGSSSVKIGGQAAARQGDTCTHQPSSISSGSANVNIGG